MPGRRGDAAERVLVAVPCRKAKTWDREPKRGPVPAKGAYAEPVGIDWVVLSAGHGIRRPDGPVRGPGAAIRVRPELPDAVHPGGGTGHQLPGDRRQGLP